MRASTTTITLVLLLFAAGCVGDDDDTTTDTDEDFGDEVTEDPPDDPCKSSCLDCTDLVKDAYVCMAFDEHDSPLSYFDCMVCDNDGEGSAALTCETQAQLQSVIYATMEAQPLVCGTPPRPPAGCEKWLPSGDVEQTGASEWAVERDAIAALVADPSPLAGCDAARVKRTDGGYRVISVESDDLLGALGFTDGDVVESVNGYSLTSHFDVAWAFFNLWPDTEKFTVEVSRPSTGPVVFTYTVI
jgi:hypothetical protein